MKLHHLFRKQSLSQVVLNELEEAKRSKLEAESGKEYAESLVAYNDARIKRLTTRLDELLEADRSKEDPLF
jgi:hypothetical protein